MDAVAEYQSASQQRVFVEYVVLSGVNDAPEQAHELGQLLQVRRVFGRYRKCTDKQPRSVL
jgi:adenine C2-methylase RlmN of 23S rRNA A2503 and tRNA A37